MNRREAIFGVAGGLCGLGAANSLFAADAVVDAKTTEESIKLLTEVRQAQRFTDDPVAEEDIQKIVTIGRNAPSARNLQPWFFAVVTNRELLKEIDEAAKVDPNGRLSVGGAPLVIFVCCEKTDVAKYDAGAAADRMNVAALLLGYGCKTVMTAPKAANEKRFKEKLGVPDNYETYTALLIGVEKERSVDGVSGATTREPEEKKVSFVK